MPSCFCCSTCMHYYVEGLSTFLTAGQTAGPGSLRHRKHRERIATTPSSSSDSGTDYGHLRTCPDLRFPPVCTRFDRQLSSKYAGSERPNHAYRLSQATVLVDTSGRSDPQENRQRLKFKRSYSSSLITEVPEDWKQANVTPIYSSLAVRVKLVTIDRSV